jgi:hypothetical protein
VIDQFKVDDQNRGSRYLRAFGIFQLALNRQKGWENGVLVPVKSLKCLWVERLENEVKTLT